MGHTRTLLRSGPLPIAAIVAAMLATPALAVEWNAVKGQDIVLFYPGQASWEWALTQSDHSGNKKFREGKDCIECHGGEERDIGKKIASGEKLEPKPIKGWPAAIDVNVKFAHDDQRLYVRLEWADVEVAGGPKGDPETEDKVTLILDDGKLVEAKRAGCWGACHDDAIGMASATAGRELTKYLARSRTKITRAGGGETYKPQGELDKLLAGGQFLEYWQARLNQGKPAVAVHGYILDKRHKDEAPLLEAESQYADGRWTVVMSRQMEAGRPGYKDIVPGTVYSLGIAIHPSYSEHRFHNVSFERTLVLDRGKADFVAVKQ